MTDPAQQGGRQGVTAHVAVRALFKSVLINMVAPAVLYRLSTPHFAPGSLFPLAISGAPRSALGASRPPSRTVLPSLSAISRR